MHKKIAFTAIGFAFLAAPLLSSADTLSDLQTQVQALMAQIQALKSQQTVTLPSTTGQPDDYGTGTSLGYYCPKLSITLQKGSRDATTGGQVSELQVFLTDYFNLDENVVAGGYFGNLTQSYVIKFQQEQGLPAFGIAGQLTRAKIASLCGTVQTSPASSDTTLSGNTTSGEISADVDPSSQNSVSQAPVIRGTATGTRTLKLELKKLGNTVVTELVGVADNGTWIWIPSIAIQNGIYVIDVWSTSGVHLASRSLTVGPLPNYDYCRLDTLGGSNITRDAITDQSTCLTKICEVAGPANLPAIESKCVFNGIEIKRYLKTEPQSPVTTPGATITVTTISGQQITVSYANLPIHSYINLLWKNENGQYESTVQSQTPNGGNGSVVMQQNINAPSGYYIAQARTTDDMNWHADSAPFIYRSSTTALNCTLSPTPAALVAGQTVVLSWSSLGANKAQWMQDTSANLLGLPSNSFLPDGSQTFTASGKGTISPILTVSRNDGLSGTCTTNITLLQSPTATTPPPTPPPPPPVTSTPPTVTITAGFENTTSANGMISVPVGKAMSIWWGSTGATSCTVTPNPTNTQIQGAGTGINSNFGFTATSQQTIFTVTCLNASGQSASASVTINPTTAISSLNTAQLASALTALQSALEALIAQLGQ